MQNLCSIQYQRFLKHHNLLAKTKSTPLPTLFPLPDLLELFSTFFRDKIIKLRLDFDSQPVCTSSLPLTNPFDGIPLCTFKPVSESVVKNLILKSAPKTCQLDPIPTPLLVECLDTFLPSLTALVNSSLSSGVFSEVFKTALVTPLLKKKSLDQNELKNYRPVSNLSIVSMIIEKLVLSQLSDHLSANSLDNRFQSAYRPGHSAETTLLKIVSDLLLALDDGNVSLLAVLDLSAAFDTAYYFTDFIMFSEYKARPSTGFRPTLQTALSLSAFIAIHPSQLPSLSVFHRDQSLDLSFSFSIQLLFLL